MNCYFFHDAIFIRYGEKYYTTGTLNNSKFQEYINVFGKITVIARYVDINESNKIYIKKENLVNNVDFRCVPNYYSSINLIKKEISNCDFAILRVHSFISTIANYYCKKNNINTLVESVSCPFNSLWNHGKVKAKFMALPMYILTRNIIKNSKYVHYVSDNFLQSRYPTKGKQLACSDVVIEEISNSTFKDRISKIENKDYKRDVYIFGVVRLY